MTAGSAGGIFAIASLTLAVAAWGGPAQAPLTFRSEIGVVYLHATVRDDRGTLVTGLERGAFRIYENGAAQELSVFRRDEVPISLGILLDDSGSMRASRAAVEAAGLAALRASKAQDETFVMNFADKARVDAPLTHDARALEAAVPRLDAVGGTALFDAVAAALDYLAIHASRQRKALLVITDGNDNASETPFERVKKLADQGDVAVYAVGLLDPGSPAKQGHGRDVLSDLTEGTGGSVAYPPGPDRVEATAATVAAEIRRVYSLGYSPAVQDLDGTFRKLRVVARGRERLHVRARTGYWAKQGTGDVDGSSRR